MFRTAVRVTSDVQEQMDAVNLAELIATSNGYIANVPRRPSLIAQRDYAKVDKLKKTNFYLAFITDDLSKAIRASQNITVLACVSETEQKRKTKTKQIWHFLILTWAKLFEPTVHYGTFESISTTPRLD
ncbi:hypothetical protein RB195_025523 [Necator americanus]|uniref:Uncharacterized protein n=1 Tax=Necator americanus TaxID=51031 RepID=A0ABR1ESR7_NECAM